MDRVEEIRARVNSGGKIDHRAGLDLLEEVEALRDEYLKLYGGETPAQYEGKQYVW